VVIAIIGVLIALLLPAVQAGFSKKVEKNLKFFLKIVKIEKIGSLFGSPKQDRFNLKKKSCY
jgi:branched-subunit amino acid permease